MNVTDLIANRTEVFSISIEATVHDAAKYLREKQIRSAGILDTQSRLMGVISQSDISDKVAAENKCPAWTRVTEIMSTRPVTVSPDTSLDECARLMDKHGIFHLAVVDPVNGFRGLISVQDLLKVIASDQKARADMLEAYMFPSR
ncbi:MAG: CBS domain-containing protein [Terriglobia bacterium]